MCDAVSESAGLYVLLLRGPEHHGTAAAAKCMHQAEEEEGVPKVPGTLSLARGGGLIERSPGGPPETSTELKCLLKVYT